MNGIKLLAIGLIVAGVLGLAYGGFTYTKETQEATFGPINFTFNEKETVNVPIWVGVVAVLIGGGLLFYGTKRG